MQQFSYRDFLGTCFGRKLHFMASCFGFGNRIYRPRVVGKFPARTMNTADLPGFHRGSAVPAFAVPYPFVAVKDAFAVHVVLALTQIQILVAEFTSH